MVNPVVPDALPEVANPLAGKQASEQFIARHWQRHPVLIRAALSPAELAALTSPRAAGAEPAREMSPTTMWALAGEEETEARLIRRRGRKWSLDHGPFEPEDQPAASQKQWTLLVQSVDHHLDDASDLLHRFNFLPQCRLDDLMISVAGDQGGVGPHKDSYDVFLLQLAGSRHWTIGAPGDHELQGKQPLRLVREFASWTDVLVEPGDMLYVPPGWIHDGVAQGHCMTASIGFRSPTRGELLSAWLQASAEHCAEEPGAASAQQYCDRTSVRAAGQWRRQCAQVPGEMIDDLQRWLKDWRPTATEMREFIGCYLTEPKASVWFERPAQVQISRFLKLGKRNGVKLDRRTRISFAGRVVYINGEPWVSDRPLSRGLKQLANHRQLDAVAFSGLSIDDQGSLAMWHETGWLHPIM